MARECAGRGAGEPTGDVRLRRDRDARLTPTGLRARQDPSQSAMVRAHRNINDPSTVGVTRTNIVD